MILNQEQEKIFEEWFASEKRSSYETNAKGKMRKSWQACLEANKVAELQRRVEELEKENRALMEVTNNFVSTSKMDWMTPMHDRIQNLERQLAEEKEEVDRLEQAEDYLQKQVVKLEKQIEINGKPAQPNPNAGIDCCSISSILDDWRKSKITAEDALRRIYDIPKTAQPQQVPACKSCGWIGDIRSDGYCGDCYQEHLEDEYSKEAMRIFKGGPCERNGGEE